jgi:hypothetical protein
MSSQSGPFFMFSAQFGPNDPLGAVLRKYVTSNDYLSTGIAKDNPDLATRVGRMHTYTLPASVSAVARQAQADCRAGLIIYDGEHWSATPEREQADMPAAIAAAKSATTSAGCEFGLAPDGQYAGLIPKTCSYRLDDAVHRQIDLRGVALYNVQAQRLLSDECASQGGVDAYIALMTAVTNDIHAKSPGTKVSAQFSFRYTPPDRMISVIGRLRGVVDGFYIAYPVNVGGLSCQYCSAENLDKVLAAIR